MNFDADKEKTLKRMLLNDKSDKGSVDKPIQKLVNLINAKEDYYTLSSCSGRIVLLYIPDTGKKREAEFIVRTHDLIKSSKVKSVIKELLNYVNYNNDGSIWFKQDPPIVHIGSRTLKQASDLLRNARTIGFKRNGLFEVEKRFLMELVSTERTDAIIAQDGKLLVPEEYIKTLIEVGNKKLEQSWTKIKKLEAEIKKL